MLSVGIRQIEYVVAVAGHGGVTTAADALHVSQLALPVAISRKADRRHSEAMS
jgi:DNA-binding transcriptional LysR family regulator